MRGEISGIKIGVQRPQGKLLYIVLCRLCLRPDDTFRIDQCLLFQLKNWSAAQFCCYIETDQISYYYNSSNFKRREVVVIMLDLSKVSVVIVILVIVMDLVVVLVDTH